VNEIQRPNFIFGATLVATGTARELIARFPVPIGPKILLEYFKYNDSFPGTYERWEILYNNSVLINERLRCDNQTLRINLPWFKLVPPGMCEVYVTPTGIGRLYTFTLIGKYLAD
jgi:hypothetical protein